MCTHYYPPQTPLEELHWVFLSLLFIGEFKEEHLQNKESECMKRSTEVIVQMEAM